MTSIPRLGRFLLLVVLPLAACDSGSRDDASAVQENTRGTPVRESAGRPVAGSYQQMFEYFGVPNAASMFGDSPGDSIRADSARYEEGRLVLPARFASDTASATKCRAAGLVHAIVIIERFLKQDREKDFVVDMECQRHLVQVEVKWAQSMTVTEYVRRDSSVVYQRSNAQ